MEKNEKVGNFEWILSFSEIKEFLTPAFLGYNNLEVENVQVLVIGCGTSNLGESLAQNFAFRTIYAVDNDRDCILHMKSSNCSTSVIYEYYDLVDLESNPLDSALQQNGIFHLIVDKGTFDAILVEGSVVNLLSEIVRLLCSGGKYVLFTINEIGLIKDLTSFPTFPLEIIFEKNLFTSKTSSGNLVIFQKKASENFNLEEFAVHEKRVLDEKYKFRSTFLTEEYETHIRNQYLQRLQLSETSLSLQVAYEVMFGSKPDLGYDYDLFLEDLSNFPLKEKTRMDCNEIIWFLHEMQ
jgi:SAM-dependent methyltransferase